MPLPVVDQLAIQQLYARYNHSIDSGQAEEWAACFTPEGAFSASSAGTFTGTEALAGFARGFAAQLKARHWTNNLLLDGDGRTATGRCYLMLMRLQPGNPATVLATGLYEDQLTKTAGGWRFASRSLRND